MSDEGPGPLRARRRCGPRSGDARRARDGAGRTPLGSGRPSTARTSRIPCTGCSSCGLKTPGRCVVKDDMQEILRMIVASELLVLATPVRFGSYCAELKKVIDRFQPLMVPIYVVRDGEMHFQGRYDFPVLLGVGLVSNGGDEEARAPRRRPSAFSSAASRSTWTRGTSPRPSAGKTIGRPGPRWRGLSTRSRRRRRERADHRWQPAGESPTRAPSPETFGRGLRPQARRSISGAFPSGAPRRTSSTSR